MDEVVGIELTAKEVEEYLISKIDSDEKFIEEFPKTEFSQLYPTESSQSLKGKSKELQLDLAYEIFKSFISYQSIILKEYKLPPEFSLKDYLPFTEIIDSVSSLDNTCFEDLDDEQKLQVWIHKRLFYGIMYTKSTVIEAYSYKPPNFEDFKDEWQKKVGLKTRTLDYFLEAEDHFKSRINRQPDLQTKKLIQELKDKVQELVKKDKIKLQLKTTNPLSESNALNKALILFDKADNAINSIIEEIPFYDKWHEQSMPQIHETLTLCKWEREPKYSLFLEKLLYSYMLKDEANNILYPKEKKTQSVIEQKRKEQELYEQVTERVKDWIVKCFSDRISDQELNTLMITVELFFTQKQELNILPITKVKDLESKDIMMFIWVVWKIFQKLPQSNVKQDAVAKYIKEQFPNILKDCDPIYITKHLTDNGNYIKKPRDFKKMINK